MSRCHRMQQSGHQGCRPVLQRKEPRHHNPDRMSLSAMRWPRSTSASWTVAVGWNSVATKSPTSPSSTTASLIWTNWTRPSPLTRRWSAWWASTMRSVSAKIWNPSVRSARSTTSSSTPIAPSSSASCPSMWMSVTLIWWAWVVTRFMAPRVWVCRCSVVGRAVGALYVRRKPRVRLVPLMSGGGQERGLRSGTLATPLCVVCG